MSKKESAAKSVFVVMVITALSTCVSLGKELVFANYFGVSASTDAFSLAYQLPDTLFAVFSSAIAATILPLYTEELSQKGRKEASKFASKYTTLIVLITVIFVILCEIFADPIIYLFSPGLNSNAHILAVRYIRIFFLIMISTAITSINSGILNANHVFGREKVSVVIRNTIYILFMVLLSTQYGIWAAVVGLVVGVVSELIFSCIITKKFFTYRPDFDFHDSRLLLAAKRTLPVLIGTGISEIKAIIDKIIASFLDSGSITSLSYASKLNSAITGVVLYGITTVAFPYFAEKISTGDKKGLNRTFEMTMKAYLILFVPLTSGAILLSEELVEIVFLRGAFTANNVSVIAPLFAIYAAAMIFLAIRTVCVKVFHAAGNTTTPVINGIIGVIIQIFLSITLSRIIGINGIAISSTVSNAIIAVLMLIFTRRYIEKSTFGSLSVTVVKSCISSLLMVIAIVLFGKYFSFNILIIDTFIKILIGIIVYFVALIVLRTKEVMDILRDIKEKLLKVKK